MKLTTQQQLGSGDGDGEGAVPQAFLFLQVS